MRGCSSPRLPCSRPRSMGDSSVPSGRTNLVDRFGPAIDHAVAHPYTSATLRVGVTFQMGCIREVAGPLVQTDDELERLGQLRAPNASGLHSVYPEHLTDPNEILNEQIILGNSNIVILQKENT